jgi:hypothetical protein
MAEGPRGRPAPLVLVVEPDPAAAPLGGYAAVATTGQRLLATELSRRLGEQGAAVARLPALTPAADFHWGRWFAAAARAARREAESGSRPLDALGYAGAGALALLGDTGLDALLSPVEGEVVANNRFSADAFVVAGDLDAALEALASCPTDNAAVRCLESVGFRWRDLSAEPWSRFDVDTPLDLALLRLGSSLPGGRVLDGVMTAFLETTRLPAGGELEVPQLASVGEVIRSRDAELVVAGRIPSSAWAYLEAESACRVRCFIEERGMRSARDHAPRSLLAGWVSHHGASGLVAELTSLGDGVILDTRVLMASLAGSADASAWPEEDARFASDFLDRERAGDGWLGELVEAATDASVPFLLGGHALVSDGLRILVEASWQGR